MQAVNNGGGGQGWSAPSAEDQEVDRGEPPKMALGNPPRPEPVGEPSRLKWYLPDQLRWLDDHRGAGYMPCGQLVGITLQQCADIMESQHRRIMATRRVIEDGYRRAPDPYFSDQCTHGRPTEDDCIACYDEALMAALTSDRDRDPVGDETRSGSVERSEIEPGREADRPNE